MKFKSLPIVGAYLVEPVVSCDDRGSFARMWCERDFHAQGIDVRFVQHNVGVNLQRGTIRGLHYQIEPHGEDKLIWCAQGSAFDVMVDLRPNSATYTSWYSLNLTASNCAAVFIPKGVAHGYQSLEQDTKLVYLMSDFYEPEAARGVRWNDPAFQIPWPIANPIMSPRDAAFADFVR